MFKKICQCMHSTVTFISKINFLGPLALRLYLVPVLWISGMEKLTNIDSTAEWFANPDWGLGLPFPLFMAYAASLLEVVGSILLLIGLGVRWIAVPLMLVMVVAALTVHAENGWLAIASQSSEAHTRLQDFIQWLEQAHPTRLKHITEFGDLVVLKNGVEFAVTYFIMILSLFFTGAGSYLSMDYWVNRLFCKRAKT